MPWPVDNPPLRATRFVPATIKEVTADTPLNVQIALAGVANGILERQRLIKAYDQATNPPPTSRSAALMADEEVDDPDDLGDALDDERRRP